MHCYNVLGIVDPFYVNSSTILHKDFQNFRWKETIRIGEMEVRYDRFYDIQDDEIREGFK